MPRWAIVIAHGDAESSSYHIHKELEGTEGEALAALLSTVEAFQKGFQREIDQAPEATSLPCL